MVVETDAFMDPGSNVSYTSKSVTLYEYRDFEVYDIKLNHSVELPTAYSKDVLPVSRSHIPTQKDIEWWPHLDGVTHAVIKGNIGLLIGSIVPDAYAPLQVKTGPRGSPHAIQSQLGWIVLNVIRPPPGQEYVHSTTLTVNKAIVTAAEHMKKIPKLEKLVKEAMNQDFPEALIEYKKEFSQQDKWFTQMVKESMTFEDGHYKVPLTLKNKHVKSSPTTNHRHISV